MSEYERIPALWLVCLTVVMCVAIVFQGDKPALTMEFRGSADTGLSNGTQYLRGAHLPVVSLIASPTMPHGAAWALDRRPR